MVLRLIFSIIASLSLNVQAGEAQSSAVQEITIANFSQESPPCHVQIPRDSIRCVGEICELPAPRGSSLKSIQLTLSCIPASASTGFENPPPGTKVFSIQTANSKGHVSLIDEPPEEPGERMRELYFCLYSDVARLCGFSKTLVLKDGEAADASKNIVKILKTIVFNSR